MHTAKVSAKGARRWEAGHPWIYRSDLVTAPDSDAGVVRVMDQRGKPLGVALWSPRSEISLRLLDPDPDALIDGEWWHRTLARAIARRSPLANDTTAYRLVHGEGDLIPSLIVDRYDRWLVVQLMSAGLERFRNEIVNALDRARPSRRHPRPQRRSAASKGRARHERRAVARLGARRDRGERARRAIPGRTVARTEDRSVPRPAREPRAGRTRGARSRARLLQLPWLVRAAPRAPRGSRDRARRIGACADARRGELPAQRPPER